MIWKRWAARTTDATDESPRTKPYDRTNDQITLDEIERIVT
jgi:hypothetical protein